MSVEFFYQWNELAASYARSRLTSDEILAINHYDAMMDLLDSDPAIAAHGLPDKLISKANFALAKFEYFRSERKNLFTSRYN